jgi:hypothetical protein
MVHIFGSHSNRSASAHLGVDFNNKAFSSPNAPAINKDVETAAKKYEVVEQKLDTLIRAVEDHHVAMKHANSKKLETVKLFDDFVKDTPLEQIVGPISAEEESSQEIENKDQDASETKEIVKSAEDAVPGLVEEKAFDSDSSSYSSEDSGEADENESDQKGNDEDRVENKNAEIDDGEEHDAKRAEDGASNDVNEHEDAGKGEEKCLDLSETEALPSKTIENVENDAIMDNLSYSVVEEKIYVETSAIADDYFEQVMHYLQSWKRINKTRIKAGLYEFKEMCEKFEHYQSKMKNMNQAKVDQEKYERNQQKLLGILEAHTTYSEKLLRYIEEVTERGWKDFYPLLLNAMEFDVAYASTQFKYSEHLKRVLEHLEEKIGKVYGLPKHGRLHELETEPLGDVYSGKRANPKPSYIVNKTATSNK